MMIILTRNRYMSFSSNTQSFWARIGIQQSQRCGSDETSEPILFYVQTERCQRCVSLNWNGPPIAFSPETCMKLMRSPMLFSRLMIGCDGGVKIKQIRLCHRVEVQAPKD